MAGLLLHERNLSNSLLGHMRLDFASSVRSPRLVAECQRGFELREGIVCRKWWKINDLSWCFLVPVIWFQTTLWTKLYHTTRLPSYVILLGQINIAHFTTFQQTHPPYHTTPHHTTPHHTTPHHATPHHTTPYHTTPRHTTPHHTTQHHTTSHHTTPPHTTPHHTKPHHTTPHHTTPHHPTPHHTTPNHITPHHTTPHHTTPHHATPHHITPHHTTPHHTTPHHTTPHHATPHHTTPHHTTPRHTTPHHAKQFLVSQVTTRREAVVIKRRAESAKGVQKEASRSSMPPPSALHALLPAPSLPLPLSTLPHAKVCAHGANYWRYWVVF